MSNGSPKTLFSLIEPSTREAFVKVSLWLVLIAFITSGLVSKLANLDLHVPIPRGSFYESRAQNPDDEKFNTL